MTTPLVLVDTQVVLHQIANTLEGMVGLDLQTRKALTMAQVALVNSGHWCKDLLDTVKVLWVNDYKGPNGYWRHEYLLREEVWSAISRKTKGRPSERKRQRYLSLREMYSDPLDSYVQAIGGENTMPNTAYKDVQEMLGLANALKVHYKAGRSFPSYSLKVVREVFKGLVDQGNVEALSCKGYEADDMASLVVRACPDEEIVLLTIDSDWLGLCNDKVTWVCAIGYPPRVRFMADGSLNAWAAKRLKATVESPRDIWALKAAQGDPSDNLPSGSPLGVIDLLEPVPEYDLFKNPALVSMAQEAVNKAPINPGLEKAPEALRYVLAHGMPLAVKPLEYRDLSIPTIDKDVLTLPVD